MSLKSKISKRHFKYMLMLQIQTHVAKLTVIFRTVGSFRFLRASASTCWWPRWAIHIAYYRMLVCFTKLVWRRTDDTKVQRTIKYININIKAVVRQCTYNITDKQINIWALYCTSYSVSYVLF